MQDASDEKSVRRERTLRDGEALYRTLFNLAPSGVVLVDEEGRFVAFNDQAHQQLGYTREEFARLRLVDLHPAEKRGIVPTRLARLFEKGGDEFECRHRAKSGEIRHVFARSRTVEIDGARRLLAVFQDITQSKRAEEALRESEEKLALALEAAGMGTWHAVPYGPLECSPRCRELYGLEEGMVIDGFEAFLRHVHPEDRAKHTSAVLKSLDPAGDGRFEDQFRWIRPDGAVRWISACGKARFADVNGVRQAILGAGTALDVTERELAAEKAREAEQELRESEERFRTAFHTSPDSININRLRDGVFVAVNEGFSRITGWSAGEVLGRSSLELPVWDDPADRSRLVAGLERDGFVENLEARFRRKDGTTLSGLMSARLITLRGERCLLSHTRDISEWRRAEEERDRLKSGLHQAAKMEAIGQLAGGVAHDFNNLLTVILSGAEALKHHLAEGSTLDPEVVEEIAGAGARARDLVRQLLAFARRQVFTPVPVDLNALILGTEKLLRRVVGEDVELVTNLQRELWPLRCDPGQMEQVILNLAVNSRDAMPNGGRLVIETSNQEVSQPQAVLYPGIAPGPHVRLAVHDSGTGMSPQVRMRLFEPFFTTKPLGKGTGLGLATVHGIVKQSGGYIRVESEPNYGTTFELLFPRTAHGPQKSSDPEPTERTSARARATVLLVEDDPHVRSATARALLSDGYELLVASNGLEAIEILASHRRRLDLLVTDVMMPGVDGRKLAEAVRREWPDVRVLFVSGHAHDVLGERGILNANVDLLAKPYTPTSLLDRVRTALRT